MDVHDRGIRGGTVAWRAEIHEWEPWEIKFPLIYSVITIKLSQQEMGYLCM